MWGAPRPVACHFSPRIEPFQWAPAPFHAGRVGPGRMHSWAGLGSGAEDDEATASQHGVLSVDSDQTPKIYDAFICHASEDKDDFVRPLANLLIKQHLDVWYDEFSLTIGDSLSDKIDQGLKISRFGIVILSPQFFRKPWAKRELKGLVAREVFERQDVILPVWHRVSLFDVMKFSPTMADKKAASSADGINTVLRELIRKIRPEESPLVIARDALLAHNFDPPPISDEWWLDVVEYKEFLRFPDINAGKRWIFPLPFRDEKRGHERGANIASTALQMDWSFEGEELNISPITPPEQVHSFLRRWPGLFDCAIRNPTVLALYVPQLTIRGFDLGFEEVFDKLMVSGNPSADVIFSYGLHDTVNDGAPLCGNIVAFRHPTFGNYTPAELAYWYFRAHDSFYKRSNFNSFEGLVWLLSDDAHWLPDNLRSTLVMGTGASNRWVNDLMSGPSKNPFLDAILGKTRKQFRFTRSLKNSLTELVEVAKINIGLNQPAEKIVQGIIDAGLVDGYYDWRDYVRDKRKR